MRWRAVFPFGNMAVFRCWLDHIEYEDYKPDTWPLEIVRYDRAYHRATAENTSSGWEGTLALDTAEYLPPYRDEEWTPLSGVGYAPERWDLVPACEASARELRQLSTPDCLGWEQTQHNRAVVSVELSEPIPRRSRVRIRFWTSTGHWLTAPQLLVSDAPLVAPRADWGAVLGPQGLTLADPATGRIATRSPALAAPLLQALPTDTEGSDLWLEGTVPYRCQWLTFAVYPGHYPRHEIEDCTNPPPPEETPLAEAIVAVQEVWYLPPEEPEPWEGTRGWVARQVLARNVLR